MEASRIERLLEDQPESCRNEDVENRLAALEALNAEVPSNTSRDRAALRTLGDDTRHRIVRLLAAADRDLCVCELTPLMDVSESAVSHGLGDLTAAGLVERRKEGTWHYYRPTRRAVALLSALDTTSEAPA